MGEVITLLFSKSGVLCSVAVLTLIQVERKKQSRCVFLHFPCILNHFLFSNYKLAL